MKTSLEHLPERKQQELKWATDIIREETNPEMIILFGSYARGDWVEELGPDGVHYQYQSDFDLLVVMETERLATKVETNNTLWNNLTRRLKTPVSLIAEDIQFINRRLGKGQYFYADIQREGIMLYDSGRFELAQPKELNVNERTNLAEEDFEQWFNAARDFYKTYNYHYSEHMFNLAAFDLHQTTERLYGTILLVFTRYKPSTHDLRKLSKRVSAVEPQFLRAFPQGTEEEKQRFELLRKAYVDGRYKPSYNITQQELEWLAQRVQHLQQLTEKLCKAKIASFG